MLVVFLILLTICSLELLYLILYLAEDKDFQSKNELVKTIFDIENYKKANIKLQKKMDELKSIKKKIDMEISFNKACIAELKKQAKIQSKEQKLLTK